jgi:hypothetical protein
MKFADKIIKYYRNNIADNITNLFLIKNYWKNVIYVHSPFCLEKCKYCIYHSYIGSEKDKSDFYNVNLPSQFRLYNRLLNSVNFDEIYFGGGTPTVANAKILENIFCKIPNFNKIPKKMTEIHPYSVTDEHLSLFKKYNFSYISMGVQTLSERILRKHNRLFVSKDKLKHIINTLSNYKIISNVDLIFFLDSGELSDLRQGEKDLEYVMKTLKPKSIVIHLNYKARKSVLKNIEVMKLIRKYLSKYHEYKCTNSLLKNSDAVFDSENNAEYRLMKDEIDFEFYMAGCHPNIPIFGYNILGLGYYKHIDSITNIHNFVLKNFGNYSVGDNCTFKIQNLQKIYNRYVKVRENKSLSYFNPGNYFYKNKQNNSIFKTIIREIKNIPMVISKNN